ncbi:zinc ribbon domain-containing protein [Streptomyces sp. NPDC002004]
MTVIDALDGVHTDEPRSDMDGTQALASGASSCGLRDGALWFQRCHWCRAAVYQKLLCPFCGSTELTAERSGGTGLVRRASASRTAQTGRQRRAWIEMAEGFHLRATVIGLSPLTAGEWVPVHLAPEVEDASRGLVFRFTEDEPQQPDWR